MSKQNSSENTTSGITPRLETQKAAAQSTLINTVLARWEPQTGIDPHVARAQTRRAVEWLSQHDVAKERTDFVAALAEDSTLTTEIWWGGAVHLGLHQFVEAGLVEYRSNTQAYRWIGE